MVEANTFPLLLWEQTEAYRKELTAAEERFRRISGQLNRSNLATPYPYITFTGNCIPVIWMNHHRVPYGSRRWSAKEALNFANRYGCVGYFRAEDLEDYLKGRGVVVEEAMNDMGFRRHKRDQERWVRKHKGEEGEEPYLRNWEILYGTDFETPDEEERARLFSLMIVRNIRRDLGRTFSLTVGRTGLIYVALDVNPFAGKSAQTIGELGEQLSQRAHIDTRQEGFVIAARNIRLFDLESEGHDAIHMVVRRDDETSAEVVWPETASSDNVVLLAAHLRKLGIGRPAVANCCRECICTLGRTLDLNCCRRPACGTDHGR